ncbi:MAG: tRNA pseudouridine(55) synthase TruB [Phycisphaerae bacterium]|nr:tRNA pseudouridine(55) synthase TruB [Phycisphaerae bacterium]
MPGAEDQRQDSNSPSSDGSDDASNGSRRAARLRRRDSASNPLPAGVVVIDKPSGMSSMTAVSIVRRKADLKAGHAGTLDPLATGVLVIGVGRATKSLDRFMKTRKGYLTEIDLSAFTATDDREAELEPVDVGEPPTDDVISTTLQERFTGEFMQTPPNFSAKKVQGRRAYARARKGESPALEPRPVMVHRIELEDYQWPIATVRVCCEKGFYVRSLARDLGRALGTGGHCASIRRTAVGPFTIEQAVDPDDLPNEIPPERIIPLSEAIEMLEASP